MKIFKILLLSLLFIVVISCNSSNQYKEITYDVENPDFSFLKEALEGKRVVALGESSHSYGDLQLLKGKMVQYLHDELDFDVIMLEAGYGDTKMAWENIGLSNKGVETKNNSLYGNLRSNEINPLFEYIKEQSNTENKLEYAGYDTQLTGLGFKYKLNYIIEKIEIKLIQDSVKTGIESLHKMFRMRDSLDAFQHHKNRLFAGIDLAKSVLNDNKDEILENEIATENEFKIELNALDYLRQAMDYGFGEAFTVGLAKRDSLMAEIVIQQMKTEFQDKKIILWGHNGHLEKDSGEGNSIKWMGHYLKEAFNDEYYVLGMYCKKGYEPSNKEQFDINDNEFIEKKLYDISQSAIFINLPKYNVGTSEWYSNQIYGYEPEAGGKVSFIPSKRFDGIMLLPNTNLPSFN